MQLLKKTPWIVLAIALLSLGSCGGGGSSGGGSVSSGTGELSLSLTDATTDQYRAVYVTIDEVTVHVGNGDGEEGTPGGWITVAKPEKTYNLLELVNGVMAPLGIAELDEGVYSQMRLHLGDTPDEDTNVLDESHPYPQYVVGMDDDTPHELKVPSGYQTGVKLVHSFEIVAGLTLELVLDFDASASVVSAGASGLKLLKPTIKVQTLDNAIINGTVSDSGTGEGIEGAIVSAQMRDDALDSKEDPEAVIRYTATITAGDGDEHNKGEYFMYLPPGEYTLVAYAGGYDPACVAVDIPAANTGFIENFALEAAFRGRVYGTVSIPSPEEDQIAVISFRRECDGQFIEVVSLNGTDGLEYDISLPAGEYFMVASTEGSDPYHASITVEADDDHELNITF